MPCKVVEGFAERSLLEHLSATFQEEAAGLVNFYSAKLASCACPWERAFAVTPANRSINNNE
jgi:hypothetical protein